MTMIEKVARAIAKTNGDDYDALPTSKSEWVAARGEFGGRYRDPNEPYRADYDDMAESALEALREPSAHMLEAGYMVGYPPTYTPAANVWRAMIDTALNEKPPAPEGTGG